MSSNDADDDEKYTVEFAPGAADDLPPEVADSLKAEMQAMLDLGGPDALMEHFKPRAVRFVDVITARCEVCKGILTRDETFEDEYFCDATTACRHYVYCDQLSEQARKAIERLNAIHEKE